jgi:hypothetical protein
MPDPRTRHRQRTCGEEACRVELRRRTQAAYRRSHADYWTERRLREQVERATERVAAGGSPVVPPPARLRGVPWELTQDVFGIQGTVLLGFFVRLSLRAAQDELRAQPLGIIAESDGLQVRGRQAESDLSATSYYRPP